jgi:adenosylmethionine-8-amino-7-oxononanoate aminotransferase
MITSAKGLSSAYAAIGALIASERVMEPFAEPGAMYSHGITFGGHPVQAAVALKNIEIMKRERIVEHVRETEGEFRSRLESMLELPIVGDLRGCGFLLRARARQGQRDTRELQRRGVRRAAAPFRFAAAVPARADLPLRRSRRSGRADLAAAGGR